MTSESSTCAMPPITEQKLLPLLDWGLLHYRYIAVQYLMLSIVVRPDSFPQGARFLSGCTWCVLQRRRENVADDSSKILSSPRGEIHQSI